ncbi:FAD-dependent oxidoreductase [Parasutterella excrementihominis]|uniref:FAD-dependent oxidoreductase n=1 Tax=Parasutterella excrementihominis TaxID=487175 RepID=UPI003A92E9CB
MKNIQFSRRNLLGASVAALASSAFAAKASANPAPVPQKWDEEVDVIVVGSGFAGLAAAYEAAKAGSKVIILEKMPTHGGNSIINGGEMTAVGCPQQKAANIPDSVEQWKADTFAAGLGFNYPEKIQVLADNMLNNYNWLVNEIGVKFRPIITQDGGHRYPRSVISEEGSGADIAYRQVQDPKLTDKFDTTNHRGATGELWKEAARNGVLMIQADRVQVVPWCSPYEKSMGNMWQFSQTCAAPYGIWVDVNTGKRFINELGNRKVRSDAIIALNNIGHKCISLTDVRGAKQLEKNRPGTLPKLMATKGLLEFPTLEAVAKYYGTPYDVLKGEVDQYNANVRNKIEVDSLGKTYNADCTEMKTGPWYAAELMPKIHHCMGGIVTNPQGQALDAGDLKPIPGLYAAGEACGGVHGDCRLGCNAILDCLVNGRIAGQSVAKQ